MKTSGWRAVTARALRAAAQVPLPRGRAATAQRAADDVDPGRGDAPTGGSDFRGASTIRYEPDPDGEPDPGEVVWTWVPYEEDQRRGKDRPVLVVGRDGASLLALMLTSRDHDGPGSDQADEEAHGRHWVDLGVGAWDKRGRPSQVRVDRVLRVDPSGVRREGATLDRERFELVAERLRADHGWS